MTVDEARRLLRDECHVAGSMRAWARRHGLSAAYVSDVLSGRRDIGPSICVALRLERVTKVDIRFERMKP